MTKVTVTLELPGRSRREALRLAHQRLNEAAWEDYPDRITQARQDGELGYANTLIARCDLIESMARQMKEQEA